MSKFILKILVVSLSLLMIVKASNTSAQNVFIPDTAFLGPLLNNSAVNTNADGFIQVSEAVAYAGPLDLSNAGISDLTGIEAFANITSLNCTFNQISSVDLSNNTLLTYISFGANQLTSIDLTNNNLLTELVLDGNQLSSINISSCPGLEYLYINGNQIADLNVTDNPNLITIAANSNLISSFDGNNATSLMYLGLDDNLLTNISVNNCINLEELFLNNNQLNTFNVANNLNLKWLECNGNFLSNINISNNVILERFSCNNNNLTNLDLGNYPNLFEFFCNNNDLTSLNIQNGNNTNLIDFSAINNPNLTCVQVDDIGYMQINFATSIDATASYNTICGPCIVNIPDPTFKNVLLNNATVNTNGNAEIECSEAAAYTGFLMLAAESIDDLTGIEAFVNLTGLNCSANSLDTLDITSNVALVDLRCVGNNLTGLNISYCPNLTKLYCWNNQLTSLNFADNPNLDTIDFSYNFISNIDLDANTGLLYLNCSFNQIVSIDLSSNTILEELYCNDNFLTSLNIQNGNNSNLISFIANNNDFGLCVQVDDVTQMTTDWSNAIDATATYSLTCAACTINIPDANFKNALLANFYINTNSNLEIECSEANNYVGSLFIQNSNITDLTGIEDFTQLEQLDCYMNQIATMDLSANTSLYFIDAHSNLLTNLILPAGSNLSEVIVSDNQLTSIDVSSNSYLTYLDCNSNQLSSLNVSNAYLSYLFCSNNQIVDLDCSNNSSLIQLGCANNMLSSLNIQNGNNSNLTSFDATNNPQLTCVQVDSVAGMNTNWPGAIDATASYSSACAVCTVNIPDANFKNALVSNFLINSNGDNEIQCAEADNFTGIIQVMGLGITDLTGIEAFINITELNCAQNIITGNLDLSSNTLLTDLDCSENQLTGLNVSACTMLYELVCAQNQITGTIDVSSIPNLYNFRCEYNQLTSIDVTNNINLYSLGCGSNQLSNLDVSNNPSLVHLEFEINQIATININNNTLLSQLSCSQNLLSNLDVSNNTNLEVFYCDFNQLSNLNVSNNTLLEFFNCSDNMLSTINVSNNTAIYMLYCSYNQINGYLDLSNHTALGVLNCSYNQLIGLNIQNGNNLFLSFFDATQNPNLTCVQVDSVQLMNTNWSSAIDATAIYSLSCAACTVNIPDANFKNELLANLAINTNADNEIQCAEAAAFTGYLNVQLSNITDLTGIEAFTSIDSLNCMSNQLTSLDLSSNTALIFVQCYGNQLTSLNVTGLTNLKVLYCYLNNLTSINVSTNTALILLNCNANQLTSINTSANTQLISLGCGSNQISNLNLVTNTLLTTLGCNNNQITSLNLQFNPLISTLTCDNNQISYLDLSNLTQLDDLGATDNLLTYLNVQNGNNINLQDFDATGNPNLTCIQVDDVNFMNSNFAGYIDATASYSLSCACVVAIPDINFKTALLANSIINTNGNAEIECSEAASFTDTIYVDSLSIADLTGIEAFTGIKGLVCNNNLLTTLDLTGNTALQFLHVYNNQLTALNVSNNAALVNLWCSYNNLNTIDVSNNLNLEGFACFYNNFTSLDVTNNLALKDFRCAFNPLTTIDVSNNTQLELWYTGNCNINTLDLSNNLLLQELDCGPNQLTTLDVSNNQALFLLEAGQNDLVELDLSNNPALTTIFVNGNALTSLYINNGNNNNLNNFSAVNNPNLTCIQVDDVNYMNANWANAKDAIANYNIDCSINCLPIPITFAASNTNISTLPMNAAFTNTSPNLTNYNFVWYFGDGTMLQSNAANVNHTYNFNGVYSVALVAYDVEGCIDTLIQSNYITCNASGALTCNHTVSLNPSGVVNACAGSIVPLNSTTSLINPNYQWNKNGVMIGGASQDNYFADANGNYTLTVFDAQGCPVTSSPVQINYSLQSSVAPTITATGPAGTCGNVNVTLTANGSFANYLWSTGQTGNSINVTQGGSYTVIGQSPACDAVSLPYDLVGSVAPVPPICMITVDETDNKNVIIWEKPISNAIDSFLVLREDINTPSVYTQVGALGYIELSEFKDNSSDANARAYRYKLAVKDTCNGITIPSTEQRSIHLDVAQGNSILARQLTWNVYQGQPQGFDYYLIYRETAPGNLNLALIDSVPSTQTWYYDNTLTTIGDTARAYKIGYRVTTPCVSTRAQNDICSSNVTANERPLIDGIKSVESSDFNWSIFPNPNEGKFIIQCNANKSYQLKVFNLIGEELHQQMINENASLIDLSMLSNGVYIVTLFDGVGIANKRLVLAK